MSCRNHVGEPPMNFRYRVSSQRYEGNCSKTKGQQRIVRFIEGRAVTEAIVLKEFPLQKIDGAESGKSQLANSSG